MPSRETYEYAIIRLVPKVEREEFMNIGVILFSKRKDFLGIKYHIDEKKIRAFSDELDVDMIKEYLQGWESVCEGGSKGGEIGKLELPLRFRWLVATRSTVIQSSKTHPGLCVDPQQVLVTIFERMVL